MVDRVDTDLRADASYIFFVLFLGCSVRAKCGVALFSPLKNRIKNEPTHE